MSNFISNELFGQWATVCSHDFDVVAHLQVPQGSKSGCNIFSAILFSRDFICSRFFYYLCHSSKMDPIEYEWKIIEASLTTGLANGCNEVNFLHALFPLNESKLRARGYEVVQSIVDQKQDDAIPTGTITSMSKSFHVNIWGPDNLMEKHESLVNTRVTRNRPLLTLAQRVVKFGRVKLDRLITAGEELETSHLKITIHVRDAPLWISSKGEHYGPFSDKSIDFTSLKEFETWKADGHLTEFSERPYIETMITL